MNDYRVELKHFTWHKDQRLLTTELSNLPGLNHHMHPPTYITIDNPDTKQSRVFRFVKKDSDEEGDTVCWRYENISHGLKLTIWND